MKVVGSTPLFHNWTKKKEPRQDALAIGMTIPNRKDDALLLYAGIKSVVTYNYVHFYFPINI